MNNKWQWGNETTPTQEQKTFSELEHLMRMVEFSPSKENREKLQNLVDKLKYEQS